MASKRTQNRLTLLSATVTPLASILGSGLLIIVPVLERTLGVAAVFGAVGICAVACASVSMPMARYCNHWTCSTPGARWKLC